MRYLIINVFNDIIIILNTLLIHTNNDKIIKIKIINSEINILTIIMK